jgi:hypothetical protein
MKVTFDTNKLVIEDDDITIDKLKRINQHWPKLLEEYIGMIIRNRERQLERIIVTNEIRERSRNRENK